MWYHIHTQSTLLGLAPLQWAAACCWDLTTSLAEVEELMEGLAKNAGTPFVMHTHAARGLREPWCTHSVGPLSHVPSVPHNVFTPR
eukprot:3321365-Prymnesium_polylepis.1